MTSSPRGGHKLPMEALLVEPDHPSSARAGTDDARHVAELFDAHADFVWRSLRRLGMSAADAEDLTQEVFLVAHRRRLELSDIDSVRGWLYGIARRTASVRRRGRRRRRQREQRVVRDDPGVAPDQPDVLLEGAERASMIQRAVSMLSPAKREVFTLYYVEELSASDIGRALGLSPNTVHSRLRLARNDVRRRLEEMGGLDADG